MALENVVEVHDGKVVGAYTAQAKNVAYGNQSVEDALDELTANTLGTPVEIAVNTDYTALSDGYFRISANAGSNYCVGRLNGNNMAVAVATSYSSGQISIFVKKGTVLYYLGSANQCSGQFYPLQ